MPTETSNPKEKTHRSSCEEMMEEMFPQDWDGCDCEEVMAQFMSQGEIPEECPGMMSRMMERFVG